MYQHQIVTIYSAIRSKFSAIGTWLPQLGFRLILAWEYGEAGFEKLHGENWFSNITFPLPFNVIPPDLSWNLALTFEIVGAFALVLGLATRFFAFSLIILTVVAIAAVHWPSEWHTISELLKGYRITDKAGDGFGNYKLPLLYILMFLPLFFSGAGKASVDYLIRTKLIKS